MNHCRASLVESNVVVSFITLTYYSPLKIKYMLRAICDSVVFIFIMNILLKVNPVQATGSSNYCKPFDSILST